MLIEKDFAGNMVREDSALLQVVMKVLLVLAPPSSIMPNQSVLGNGALQPFEQVEGVASTAVAVKKCARWQVAPPTQQHGESANYTLLNCAVSKVV